MNRFILGLVLVVGFTGYAYAGGVTDNNNGNAGYIFISTGENNGANSVGKWVDASTVPELKGAKGNTGATGATGSQGIQGVQGIQGEQGVAGFNGVDGKDGLNGINGEKGDKGNTGEQGIQGLTGNTGENGKDVDPETVNTINNNISNVDNRVSQTNSRIDDVSNRVGDLEKIQYIIGFQVRLFDSRKWSIYPFVDYTTTRNTVDRAGVRFTYKFGRSYEETRLDELEHKLNRVLGENDRLYREANSVPYVTENGIGIRDRF